MNHCRKSPAYFFACALFFASASSVAQQSPAQLQARTHFRAGVDAYTRGEYTVALSEFQSAYRIAPHHAVRVNIANCYMHLGRPIDALNHFESFLSEAATAGALPARQRTEVETQINELRRQVGEVQVRIEPTSVRDPIVIVDGQTADARGMVRMMPGRHTVEVTADGFGRGQQEVTVTAGEQSTVAILLRTGAVATTAVAATTNTTATTASTNTTVTAHPNPTATTATTSASATTATTAATTTTASTSTPTTSTAATSSTSTTGAATTSEPIGSGIVVGPPPGRRSGPPVALLIGSAAATGVFAISWGVFGGLALSANGEFNRYARQVESNGSLNAMDMQAATAASSRARTFALVSDVMLGLTVAGAAATAVLFVVTPRGAARAQEQPVVAVAPMVNSNTAGLLVGGSL